MDRSKKFWDYTAKNFDKNEEPFARGYARMIANTQKYLHKDAIVMDFACGTGKVCCEIADRVQRIQAIDISDKMLGLAKIKAEHRKINNIHFEQATLFDERYKKESFNIILAFNVLHGLENPDKVMLRCKELLKPGGTLITSTPCLGAEMALGMKTSFSLVFLLTKLGIIPLHITRYKSPELDDLTIRAGFRILETDYFYDRIAGYFIAAQKP
ncbi:MAG TPA: class I SAM-dependent methyltransferase [bacterium]|nr:class I SAM-dependent methyltransferase [bacterium]HPN45746.1 class I SAM-dependent methyltransferase [bacterium]